MPDTPFTIHWYPNEGADGGFTVPHPFRDGTVTIRTTKHGATTVPGAAAGDFLWRITISVTGSNGGATNAEISVANSLDAMSPVVAYNTENKAFKPCVGIAEQFTALHCCREKDFVDITVKTDWATAASRFIVLNSDGEIMR